MNQDVVLALLAKEPSHGAELRARLEAALGPVGTGINAGQVYVTLGRLERAGLVAATVARAQREGPDRKTYELTASGHERLGRWIQEVSWPKPDVVEFHLKLVAAAAAGLADPISLIDAQRRELLRQLRSAQRAAMAEEVGTASALLLEGVVLRLQADLRWLEACERTWSERAGSAGGAGGAQRRDDR